MLIGLVEARFHLFTVEIFLLKIVQFSARLTEALKSRWVRLVELGRNRWRVVPSTRVDSSWEIIAHEVLRGMVMIHSKFIVEIVLDILLVLLDIRHYGLVVAVNNELKRLF